MKKIFLFLCLTTLCLSGAEYAVVVARDAILPEQTAGKELQKFLSVLTGREVIISSPGQENAVRYKFYIGQTDEIKKALKIRNFNSFKPDEIRLLRQGDDFYLTGDRPRGTLYAVHTFLEDFCGMRFYAPDETYFPEKFILPEKVDLSFAPCFMIRETPFSALRLDNEFSARRKVNGHWQKTSEAWGGHETIWKFCHTFHFLLDPEKYGKSHPEYYSEIDGVRRPVGNQLCLSNKNMRRELIRNIRHILQENKNIKVISVSQDDNRGYCRCRECRLLAERYGNLQSGALVDCLNEIASALEEEYPEVLFETLAYEYSVDPPRNIVPRKNVVIRLCAADCDYGNFLGSGKNSDFRDALKGWNKLTGNLMVWNYVSLFGNHMIPNPNWGLHGRNLRFFKEHGVIAVFNQSGGGETGDFSPLRAYVNSKLLWDPDLDEWTLIREFVENYYGKAAAPFIMQYLDLMKIDYKRQKADFKLTWNTPASDWLSFEDMEKARSLMCKASEVSTGKYRARVKTAQIAIDFAFLLHPETRSRYRSDLAVPRQVLENFCAGTRHVKKYGEGLELASLKKSLRQLYGIREKLSRKELPEEFKDIPEEDIVMIPQTDLTAYEDKVRTFRMEGFIRMRADHKGWLIQFPGLGMRTQNEGRWKVYAQMRTGGAPTTSGYAFQAGFYYPDTRKTVSRRYPFKAAAGGGFKLVPIGEFVSGQDNAYFFCAPAGNDSASPIDFKALYLVRQ
ncbi:MAG: DUF4838 domain-containing protein [Lentisphaeria bacterium]|nr:DUF4838 domain-containing protein [Lentisphaeria bacterium]